MTDDRADMLNALAAIEREVDGFNFWLGANLHALDGPDTSPIVNAVDKIKLLLRANDPEVSPDDRQRAREWAGRL